MFCVGYIICRTWYKIKVKSLWSKKQEKVFFLSCGISLPTCHVFFICYLMLCFLEHKIITEQVHTLIGVQGPSYIHMTSILPVSPPSPGQRELNEWLGICPGKVGGEAAGGGTTCKPRLQTPSTCSIFP